MKVCCSSVDKQTYRKWIGQREGRREGEREGSREEIPTFYRAADVYWSRSAGQQIISMSARARSMASWNAGNELVIAFVTSRHLRTLGQMRGGISQCSMPQFSCHSGDTFSNAHEVLVQRVPNVSLSLRRLFEFKTGIRLRGIHGKNPFRFANMFLLTPIRIFSPIFGAQASCYW